MYTASGKTLGETNGKWLGLFKAVTATFIPFMILIIGLQTWMVISVFDLQKTQAVTAQWQVTTERDRFRKEDALAQEVEITRRITEIWKALGDLDNRTAQEFSKYPPKSLLDRVSALEKAWAVHVAEHKTKNGVRP